MKRNLFVLTAEKIPCKFQRLLSLEKGKRHHQNRIHKKNYIPRGKENDRSSEIFRNVKKKHPKHKPIRAPNIWKKQTEIKPEVITQLINEMRMLIQEMKTIIRIVTENKQFSKENTNIKDSTNHERQRKSNKENPKTLSFEVVSIARPSQTSPYEETLKTPPTPHQRIGTGHKTRKKQIKVNFKNTNHPN